MLEERFTAVIAEEVGCRAAQVVAADKLFVEGATVPFIARYRKEVTGGLKDEQLEVVAKRREYFLELAERRDAVLESIRGQGKLTGGLEEAVRAVVTKQELEDLYLPYRPKRRTRAQAAKEKGLEPLADALLASASGEAEPQDLAAGFVNPGKGVETPDAALAGARDILAERFAEGAENRARLRSTMASKAVLRVRVVPGKEAEGAVYRDYFEYEEAIGKIASHRYLAVLRGERAKLLANELLIDDEAEIAALSASWAVPLSSPCGRQIAEASDDGYRRLLRPSIANEVSAEARERAEAEAISVFRANLEALLMQSPLGQVAVMGLDPGQRTGCKVAVTDGTSRVVATDVTHPVPPDAREEQAAAVLVELARKHGVHAVGVGNGTACRETEIFAKKVFKEAGLEKVVVAIVPETGVSVYSASALARAELPSLDVSLRGAVSIARRLQDPLAELVKIDPRSLGVGQYQHDVDQKALARELDLSVEGVVNRVGVELNTASVALLRRVSGLNERLARSIVKHRDSKGPFPSRQSLLDVAGIGPRTFEHAAGFLRIRDGANPLDRTGVHPERYGVVEAMAVELGASLSELVGNPALVARVDFNRFADAATGLGSYTLEDIRAELERPGRDPRPEFEAPQWNPDILAIEDLKPGMCLEGRISNVTNFGAFVDIGIKRDGLVHLSEISPTWVDDPRKIVQVGRIVKVKVLEVDLERGRISLSMKALRTPRPAPPSPSTKPRPPVSQKPRAPAGSKQKKDRRDPEKGKPEKKRAPTIEDLVRKFSRTR